MTDDVLMTDEGVDRRVRAARSWLDRCRKLVGYERSLRRSAEMQFAAADNLRGIDYSRVRVSTSPTPDAIPNAVIAHMEAGESLGEIAASAAERIAECAAAIASLDDPNESLCLHLYYVDACATWEHVCVEMGYSYDNVMKIQRRALLHLYDLMPHVERGPLPPAI